MEVMATYRDLSGPPQDDKVYWAAVGTQALIGKLEDKIGKYYTSMLSTGRVDVWRRAYRMLYGWDPNGTYKSSRYITLGGEEGELINAAGNLLRAFTKAMHVQIVGSRPSYGCRTVSADARSMEMVKMGNALLDYQYYAARIEQSSSNMAWYSMPSGEGWIYAKWDANTGNPVGVDEFGRIVWSGKVVTTAVKPEDVIRDTLRADENHDWLIVSTLENRWNLAARFPDYRQEILNAQPIAQWTSIRPRMPSSVIWSESQTDMVPIYELWHKKTDALPSGRHAVMVGTSCIVIDEEMKYKELPCIPMIPNLEVDSPNGYGETWDLNNLQQAINAVISQVVSTRENFGARNVWVVPGSNIDSMQVGQGYRMIISPQKPEVLDFGGGYVQEAGAAIELLKGLMQIITGMNDTVLGDASKSQSGEALRMLHSMAMQYSSGRQAAYYRAMERAMTMVLELCKVHMSGEQIIPVVGRNDRQSVMRFMAEDLELLDSVQIEMQAASLRTSAGRIDVADKLLQAGFIKDSRQYISMIATGRDEPAFDAPYSERVLVDTENERLKDPTRAATVKALVTDDHAFHISEHRTAIADPDTRLDNTVAASILAHIQEHINLWVNAKPDLLAATGQQQAPSQAMMMQGMPPPGDPNPLQSTVMPQQDPSGGPGGAGFPAMNPDMPPAQVQSAEPEASPTTI